MQEHFHEKATAYNAHVSKGFTTLRPHNYSAPAGQDARDFHAPVSDKQDMRKMLFAGFGKCLYRVQKFDSDSERRFAVVLENDKDTLKWFKPAANDVKIYYANDSIYEPDFAVETKTAKFLCEIKAANEMTDEEVLAKARAATKWCTYATEHEHACGGKTWSYLLIPHDAIADNMTLQGLTATYIYSDGVAAKQSREE
jgi:type III restriction enzyme